MSLYVCLVYTHCNRCMHPSWPKLCTCCVSLILEGDLQSFSEHVMDLTRAHTSRLRHWQCCPDMSTDPRYHPHPTTSIVFLCVYSWWGPALTCSVWCPSWCSSSFLSWSSFFQSSSNSSQRCCPPPSRQSPKRHVFMYTQIHTPNRPNDLMTGFIMIM